MDWNEIGNRAFNRYFNCYRKTENHDECQELADDEITGAMDDVGINFSTNWSIDLPQDILILVIKSIAERMRDVPQEVGYQISGDFLWPMHTWISNKLYEAEDAYGKNSFKDLNKFINAELPKFLSNE